MKRYIHRVTGAAPSLASDSTMCLLLEPDEYEKQDEQYILTSHALRRKINKMLGIVVQHDFYEREMEQARREGGQKMAECIAKLFNVYQTGTAKEWLKPDEIRALQIDRRIDDHTDAEGWGVMVGMDFSKGDDLNGQVYLAKRWLPSGEAEWFADMDVYLSEQAADESPIRDLWHKWDADGWVHIVPGRTFSPEVSVQRIMELDNTFDREGRETGQPGVNFLAFGYDPYNAKIVVNAMSAWLYERGLDPKQMVVPVRQNFATYNGPVGEFEYMVRRSETDPATGRAIPRPMIHLSMNPLWPYCFSCCQLMQSNDGMDNVKPVKRQPNSPSCKVDPVQMLLSAVCLDDMLEGRESK